MIVTTANRFMMIFMTVPYITVISGIMMIFAPLCASKLTSQTRLTSQRRKRQSRAPALSFPNLSSTSSCLAMILTNKWNDQIQKNANNNEKRVQPVLDSHMHAPQCTRKPILRLLNAEYTLFQHKLAMYFRLGYCFELSRRKARLLRKARLCNLFETLPFLEASFESVCCSLQFRRKPDQSLVFVLLVTLQSRCAVSDA